MNRGKYARVVVRVKYATGKSSCVSNITLSQADFFLSFSLEGRKNFLGGEDPMQFSFFLS